MRLPFTRAYSRARMELGRPMTKGIIMCGNTTTSRSGTMGRVSITSILSLSRPKMVRVSPLASSLAYPSREAERN